MFGMRCPHCGVATGYSPVYDQKEVEITRGNFDLALQTSGSIYDDESGYFFGLSRCQACGRAFPVRGRIGNPNSPDTTVDRTTLEPLWPTRYRSVAPEIPSPVREAMEDASAALGAGSVIGAMLATRTAMIRAQREQYKALELSETSLKALVDAGRLSNHTFEGSDVARRVANYLGHEEPNPQKQFERADAEELYEFVEALLDELYVKPSRIERHRKQLRGETVAENKT